MTSCEGAGPKRLHRRVEDALERVREGAGRHRPAVGEARVLADGEGVGPAVLRDVGSASARSGARRRPAAAGLRCPPQSCRKPGQKSSGGYARKRGIDCVEIPDGDGDPERAALLDPARAPGCGEEECCANNQPCDGQGPAHCVRNGTRPTAAGKGSEAIVRPFTIAGRSRPSRTRLRCRRMRLRFWEEFGNGSSDRLPIRDP